MGGEEIHTQALIFMLALMTDILKFTPFNSAVDASFWQALVSKKLDILKLSEEHQAVHGEYTCGQSVVNENETVALPALFTIPANGLEIKGEGTLILTNTIEEFRTLDKNQLFQQVTEKVISLLKKKEPSGNTYSFEEKIRFNTL